MSFRRALLFGKSALLCLMLIVAVAAPGCGFERIQQDPLPDALPNRFTMEDLAEIQNNTTLTDDQKREEIRVAIDAPDNADGDRLVDFLFNFNVP